VVSGGELDETVRSEWSNLQESNCDLVSPCFAPQFTQAVAAVRDDVEVGLVQQGKDVVALFPFQRDKASQGIPVGGIVSDYQGVICRHDFKCDPQELLKGCRLKTWQFDRLLASQTFFRPYHDYCEPSAIIDLSHGYEAYVRERSERGSQQIKRCRYLENRLGREVGPVRFVSHSPDTALLGKVLGWKSEQYLRTGWADLFATRWGRELVERIHSAHEAGFAGMLSLLYAGDRLIAGHLGMRSRTVWHYWFPAYDREYARFSPGLILLLKMAEQAPAEGLRAIDLGTGITLYKQRLMNAAISVAEGSVVTAGWPLIRRTMRRTLKCLLVGER